MSLYQSGSSDQKTLFGTWSHEIVFLEVGLRINAPQWLKLFL